METKSLRFVLNLLTFLSQQKPIASVDINKDMEELKNKDLDFVKRLALEYRIGKSAILQQNILFLQAKLASKNGEKN